MFFSLLLATFLIASIVAVAVVRFFDKPIGQILARTVSEELAGAWRRYIRFAGYVVGISGGVPVNRLGNYIEARHKDLQILDLTAESWTLEIYRTIIGTLQSLAWMLLVVFVVALIAYVIVRAFELRRPRIEATSEGKGAAQSDA